MLNTILGSLSTELHIFQKKVQKKQSENLSSQEFPVRGHAQQENRHDEEFHCAEVLSTPTTGVQNV